MSRSIYGFVLLMLIVHAVLAAPAPKSPPAGLGKPVDPDRNCEFRYDKENIVIEMPGTDHDYDPHREQVNAPRLLRDLDGDFIMQFRVWIDKRPSAVSAVQGQRSCVSAGILIIPPETFHVTCIRLEFGRRREGIGEDGYAGLRIRHNGRGSLDGTWGRGWNGGWPLSEKSDHAFLRLERRGEAFYPSISPDGEKWTSLHGPIGFGNLPTKLKVGLAAYTTSTESSKVRFDRIKLAKGKKKERQDEHR